MKTTENLMLDYIYHQSPLALRIIDKSYHVIDINKEFLNILRSVTGINYRKEEVLGKKCFQLIGKDEPCEECLIHQLFMGDNISNRQKTSSALNGRTYSIIS